jgi:anti-sigma B factor antagonist
MHVEVSSKSLDKAIVVYVNGNLTTNSSPEAQDQIDQIIGDMMNNVVINVEKVDFIASTGLRIILALGKQLKSEGFKLTVCSMNETTKSDLRYRAGSP